MNAMELDHLSQSAITQAMRCGMAFYMQRIAKVKPAFRNAALVVGTVFHGCVASALNGLRDGADVTKEGMLKILDELWAVELAVEDPPIRWGARESEKPQRALLGAMISTWYETGLLVLRDAREIIAVESKMRFPLVNTAGECLLTPMVGVVDVIYRNPDGAVVVADLKTSRNGLSEVYLATGLQPSAYLHLARHLGFPDARFEYHVVTKKREPSFSVIPVERTAVDTDRLFFVAGLVERMVREKLWLPTSPDGWACAGCEYAHACGKVHQDIAAPEERIAVMV